jgi:hypothetical protein
VSRLFILLAFLLAGPAAAAEFYAAPDGTPAGDGTRARPWDLATAVGQSAIRPGDTLWLRGGTYRGTFTSTLKGTPDGPITVRQAPGERATIDLVTRDRTAVFLIRGDHVRFWGFEVTCSDPGRTSKTGGSNPGPEVRRGSIDCRASHVRFINLVVHDLGVGFGFWSEGEGGEIYGCLNYNHGWRAPDRGHGHGIYAQNAKGVKRLVDNVLFNQFSHGIHAYGSARAPLTGFHVEGNVAFHNGVLSGPEHLAPNVLVGGGGPARNVTVTRNFTYHPTPATGVRLGYGAVNEDLTLTDNYFVGYTEVRLWKRVAAKENTIVGPDTLVRMELPKWVEPKDYAWDRNTYRSSRQKYPPLTAVRERDTLVTGWREWQAAGLDRAGQYTEGVLNGTQVFVRPNQYEPGRGHVVVYNWDGNAVIEAVLSGVLKKGQAYRVVRAQDFFSRPVAAGTFDGKPVRLPMTAAPAAVPVGMDKSPAPPTGPLFEVFVVLASPG